MAEAMTPAFGALVLAGGQSKRMGRDKAQLRFKGATLLDHMRALAKDSGAHPVLTGGGPHGDLPDRLTGAGPAASLGALADYVSRPHRQIRWIILPVDMPLLTTNLLVRLGTCDAQAANFRGQPLPMMIRFDSGAREVMAHLEAQMRLGENISLHRILEELNSSELIPTVEDVLRLENVNTPEAWRAIGGDLE